MAILFAAALLATFVGQSDAFGGGQVGGKHVTCPRSLDPNDRPNRRGMSPTDLFELSLPASALLISVQLN